MVAIPLLSRASFALLAMSIFWCGAVAGMLFLHSTEATEPTTAKPAQTVRVVAVRNVLPDERVTSPSSSPSSTFEDRWPALDEKRPASPAVENARAQALSQPPPPAPDARVAQIDPVCGERGRRYFHIGSHKYWRCIRSSPRPDQKDSAAPVRTVPAAAAGTQETQVPQG